MDHLFYAVVPLFRNHAVEASSRALECRFKITHMFYEKDKNTCSWLDRKTEQIRGQIMVGEYWGSGLAEIIKLSSEHRQRFHFDGKDKTN